MGMNLGNWNLNWRRQRRVKITYLIFQAGMARDFPGIACLWILVAETKGWVEEGMV